MKPLRQRILAKHDVPEDKTEYVIECIEGMYSVEGDGWWIAADRNGTLPARIAEALDSWEAYTYATTRADAFEEAKNAPACEHGQPGGTAINPENGLSWLCPLCRQHADPRERAGVGAFWNH